MKHGSGRVEAEIGRVQVGERHMVKNDLVPVTEVHHHSVAMLAEMGLQFMESLNAEIRKEVDVILVQSVRGEVGDMIDAVTWLEDEIVASGPACQNVKTAEAAENVTAATTA